MQAFRRIYAVTAIILSAIFIYGCGDWDTIVNEVDELTENQQITVDYFKDITLGFEL